MATTKKSSGNSANKKKPTTSPKSKNSNAKSGTKSRSKPKAKKGKVYIAPYKIIILCGAIIAFCLVLLLITTVADGSPNQTEQTAITKRFSDDNSEESKTSKTEPKEVKNLKKPYSNAKANTASSPAQNEKSQVSSAAAPKNSEATKSSAKQENSTPAQTNSNSAAKTAQTSSSSSNKSQNTATTQSKSATQPETAKKNPPESSKTEKPVSTASAKTTATTPAAPAASTAAKKSDFNFPQAQNGAQLIFVFDDGGQNINHLKKFLELPFPFTVAVLPQIAHSVDSAQMIRQSGNEVILHQPMQSVNSKVNPGPGAITPDMDDEQIKSVLFQNINQISPIAGLNNHEGSAITADAEKMAVVMQLAAEQSIYFLDSRTNVETKVPYVAQEMGYSYYERNIFLDNEKTRENVLKELNKGLVYANKNGSVIMIGHIWSADFLPAILEEAYPELKAKGYTFSVVSKSKAKKN